MKKLVVGPNEYDTYLYPAVATSPAKDIKELRLVSKVLDLLEEKGVKHQFENVRLCSNCKVQMDVETVSKFQLPDEEAMFMFEDEHAEFIIKRLEIMAAGLQAWKSREILPLIDQLRMDVDGIGIVGRSDLAEPHD